ncbi:hypothetical protein [Paraburkholderia caribensis]|uniref:hypothetical protein n=1 Tax=Paraburkholderia caribensis TaxID=75105 RepID=UPI0031D263BC
MATSKQTPQSRTDHGGTPPSASPPPRTVDGLRELVVKIGRDGYARLAACAACNPRIFDPTRKQFLQQQHVRMPGVL